MNLHTARPLRVALIALALAWLTVYGGYQIGKDLAQRDARTAATS